MTDAVQVLPVVPQPDRPTRYRPGYFPWREPWERRQVAPVCSGTSCQTSLLCPWTGPQGIFSCAASLPVHEMWRRYSQPGMYEDFMPVWPSLDDTRLWIVPRAPRDSSLVCVVCRNAHSVRSVLLPETLTITQLCQSIQYLTGWEVGQVRSPPAAYARLCLADDSSTVLRDGDVLDVLACRADCHPYDIHRTAVLKDHILWTRACRLHSRVAVFVWQPGPAQPILTWLEEGSEWDPTWLTFTGQFHDRFPGMWVPVIWSPSAAPHLVKVADAPGRVHVLGEDSAGTRCLSVRAASTLGDLAEAFHTEVEHLTVLGLDCNRPTAPLPLRNGDVVLDKSFYTPRDTIWPDLRPDQHSIQPPAHSTALRPQVSCAWYMLLLSLLGRWSRGAGSVCIQTWRGTELQAAARGTQARLGFARSQLLGACLLFRGASRFGCFFSVFLLPIAATRSRSLSSASRWVPPDDSFHRLGQWRPEEACPMREAMRGSSCHYQVLCPFRGWSNPAYCVRDSTRDSLMHVVRCFAGPWASGFVPMQIEGESQPVTFLPTCSSLFATVVLHATDLTRALLLPAYSTYRQMCAFFRRQVQGMQVRISLPPALRHHAHHPDLILRLRHGDAFELSTDSRHPQHRHREPIPVAALRQLPHSHIWHLSFRLEEGGWAYVWDPDQPLGEQCSRHWIRAGLCWSPTWLQFLVPDHVTFVTQSLDSEAHVLLYRSSESPVVECRKLLLQNPGPREEANLVPPDWQLRSDIQERVVYSWPRDGDVMVPRFSATAVRSGAAALGIAGRIPGAC